MKTYNRNCKEIVLAQLTLEASYILCYDQTGEKSCDHLQTCEKSFDHLQTCKKSCYQEELFLL